ncbi:MAG TPA: chemotaxis protein CheD [Gemmatimonadaceae bacterium]|nr:chemotaxis protein CheD [Gemmatimonadaceae bacterium]
MTAMSFVSPASEIRVRVADFAVATDPAVLSTVGVGSCVAIALFDLDRRVGGLAHVLLPSETMARDRTNRAKFPATAIPLLLERMRTLGARPAHVVAKIAGGASMFTNLLNKGGPQIGERNVAATRHSLEKAGIPIQAQDVGGDYGRSIYFHLSDGRLFVRSVIKGDVIL